MRKTLSGKGFLILLGVFMNKILVTGGSGFIGSAIVRLLLKRDYEVKVFDDFSRGKSTRLDGIENHVEVFKGDIRNINELRKAFHSVDSIFHLAFINGTENFYKYPEKIMDIAVKGMQNIHEITKGKDFDSFFLASSSEVYQEPGIYPTPEKIEFKVPDIFNPRYSYGLGKIYQEFITIHSLENFRRKIIFRPHNIYGPDMGFDHVIPELFSRVTQHVKGPLLLKGDGNQQRSFCEIQDFIQAIDLLLGYDTKCDVINIGNSNEISIRKLADQIADLIGVRIDFSPGKKPLGETSRRVPDLSKLLNLGFNPQVSLRTGLENYLSWFSSRNVE